MDAGSGADRINSDADAVTVLAGSGADVVTLDGGGAEVTGGQGETAFAPAPSPTA